MDQFPDDPKKLLIKIKKDEPVAAMHVASILTATDRSFRRYAKETHGLRGARLIITETATGSWWSLLEASILIADQANKFPHLLPLFVQSIGSTYHILVNQNPGETRDHAINLLSEYAKIGRQTHAELIDLACIARVTLMPEHFELIEKRASRAQFSKKAIPPAASLQPDAIDVATVDRVKKKLESGSLEATLFFVDHTWYARPVGFEGVLLPAQLSPSAKEKAEHGAAYSVDGTIMHSSRGYPNGFSIRNLERI